MRVTNGWEPQDVLTYFETLCSMPHGSGNIDIISDYLMNFAKEHGLEAVQDDLKNVIIKKPATPGYEQAPTVIIQGHMDMVCEQDPSISTINMETDGLELICDGEWLCANGTTLGADDGIAVAMGMAVLTDDTLPHPAIEALFTVDEEIGLLGAAGLDASPLQGKLLLNLDSEDVGFTAGCAGGLHATSHLPMEREMAELPQVTVTIDGLLGGHSGGMVDKGRANADVLMGRFLYRLRKVCDFRLSDLHGGSKDNAIPLACTAVLLTAQPEVVVREAEAFDAVLKREWKASDAGVQLTATVGDSAQTAVLTAASTKKAIDFLVQVPNGLQALSMEIPGLVQTSLNLGILKLTDDDLTATFGIRSSLSSEKDALFEKLECILDTLGGVIIPGGNYPAWEFRANSRLRELASEAFADIYGKEAPVQVIHAGLECGYLCEKIPGLDAISFGPRAEDIHTAKERLYLPSVAPSYQLLTSILAKMNQF